MFGAGLIAEHARAGQPPVTGLPDWDTLCRLAAALVERSADNYAGWGEVVTFAACTAARIGEVSGVRKADIDGLR